MPQPYYYSNGIISGSTPGTEHFPIKNGNVYNLFDSASVLWGYDNLTATNANQYYTGGIPASSLYPTFSIHTIGNYQFQWSFKIASYLSGSNRSGSYTFSIFQNNTQLYSLTQTHTPLNGTYDEIFHEFTFTGSTSTTTCFVGDKIIPRLAVASDIANFTASIDNGNFYSFPIVVAGTYSYLSGSSGTFVSGAVQTVSGIYDTLVLGAFLSSYLNNAKYHPEVSSGSANSSSLYSKYGNINYNFNINPNDVVTFKAQTPFGDLKYFEYNIVTTYTSSGKVYIQLDNSLPSFLTTTPTYTSGTFNEFSILKRIQNETIVLLNFTKNSGQTSYGLLIPDNLHPDVVKNINTITKEVKTKLIGVL
jgi:hypothetical protein